MQEARAVYYQENCWRVLCGEMTALCAGGVSKALQTVESAHNMTLAYMTGIEDTRDLGGFK